MDDQSYFNQLVIQEFQRAVREKETYTMPWLDLDVPAFSAYRTSQSNVIPGPFAGDSLESKMATDVLDKDVLLLAGAGGQQSAVYGLLGAHVTVFDLMDEQLASDRHAGAHYGYSVRTIQGDMRDLSALHNSSFDRVHQPISTLYTPALPDVFNEVSRVLRPGGLYYSDYCFPLLYMAHNTGWDGSAYVLRVSQPYQRGEISELPSGALSFTEGQAIGEFHHLLSDIINGQIQAGLRIVTLLENPRPDSTWDPNVQPGSDAHRNWYLPFGISVLSEKDLRN